MGKAIETLKEYLSSLQSGPIKDVTELEGFLSSAWEECEGSGGGLSGYKIMGRLEDVKWDSPLLSFTIERHGAVKYGSSRAELQDWVFDISDGTTSYTASRYRQIHKISLPLKTKPLAEKVGKLIIACENSKQLEWRDNKTCVKVIIGVVIPDDAATQTVVGRRKRFRKDLTEFLKSYGWQEVRPNHYALLGPGNRV